MSHVIALIQFNKLQFFNVLTSVYDFSFPLPMLMSFLRDFLFLYHYRNGAIATTSAVVKFKRSRSELCQFLYASFDPAWLMAASKTLADLLRFPMNSKRPMPMSDVGALSPVDLRRSDTIRSAMAFLHQANSSADSRFRWS